MKDSRVTYLQDIWTVAVCTVLSLLIIVAFWRAISDPDLASPSLRRRDATVAVVPSASVPAGAPRDTIAESAPADSAADSSPGQ